MPREGSAEATLLEQRRRSSSGAADEEEGWEILSDTGSADERANYPVAEGSAGLAQHTCGICLEPAGSKGMQALVSAEQGASWRAFKANSYRALQQTRMRLGMAAGLHTRRLACGHVHCALCWADWVRCRQADAAEHGLERAAVRCPLCNAESHVDVGGAPSGSLLRGTLSVQGSRIRQAPGRATPAAAATDGDEGRGQGGGVRPLASTRQEQEKRERAARRRAAAARACDAQELQAFDACKQEHGALAANILFAVHRTDRFVAQPLQEQVHVLVFVLAHSRQSRACTSCVCAWLDSTGTFTEDTRTAHKQHTNSTLSVGRSHVLVEIHPGAGLESRSVTAVKGDGTCCTAQRRCCLRDRGWWAADIPMDRAEIRHPCFDLRNGYIYCQKGGFRGSSV